MGGDLDSGFFGELEECLYGDAGAVGVETAVVLGVSRFRSVVRMEAADAVVVASASLSELVGEGEAEVTPLGVCRGDVNGVVFYACGYGLDVIGWCS